MDGLRDFLMKMAKNFIDNGPPKAVILSYVGNDTVDGETPVNICVAGDNIDALAQTLLDITTTINKGVPDFPKALAKAAVFNTLNDLKQEIESKHQVDEMLKRCSAPGSNGVN